MVIHENMECVLAIQLFNHMVSYMKCIIMATMCHFPCHFGTDLHLFVETTETIGPFPPQEPFLGIRNLMRNLVPLSVFPLGGIRI